MAHGMIKEDARRDFENCIQMEKIIDDINSGLTKGTKYRMIQKKLRKLSDNTLVWSKSCLDKFDNLEEQGFFSF